MIKMNNWQIIGFLFLGFGIIFFILGIFTGYIALEPYRILSSQGILSATLNQAAQTLMLTSMVPWIATAAFCWVISIVGLIAGKTTTHQKTFQTVAQ